MKAEEANRPSQIGKSLATIGAVQVGTTAINVLTIKGVDKMIKLNNELSADEINIVKNASKDILEKTGLTQKGVKIDYVPQERTFKGFWGKLITAQNPMKGCEAGRNACFIPKRAFGIDLGVLGNVIKMPEKTLHTCVFHEIGHAVNYNLSKMGKLLQNPVLRNTAGAISGLTSILVAFSSERVAKNGEELSDKDKKHNKLRENAWILPTILTIPQVAEEAMATFRGEKLAKGLLTPKLESIMKKTNKTAFCCSYLLIPFVTAGSIIGAKKLKDFLSD